MAISTVRDRTVSGQFGTEFAFLIGHARSLNRGAGARRPSAYASAFFGIDPRRARPSSQADLCPDSASLGIVPASGNTSGSPTTRPHSLFLRVQPPRKGACSHDSPPHGPRRQHVHRSLSQAASFPSSHSTRQAASSFVQLDSDFGRLSVCPIRAPFRHWRMRWLLSPPF
jgi:hypothetical protein